MIDEENKSAAMPETPTAPAAAPAHAAPARPATVEPEDTVFSLPLSHVTQEYPALADDEDAGRRGDHGDASDPAPKSGWPKRSANTTSSTGRREIGP